jgi:glycine/D-amino acid oxidase-like deaminating enzyme
VGATPDAVQRLQREYAVRHDAGVEAASLTRAAASSLIDGGAYATRTRGNAIVDPYRATLGFARAAAARGTKIFEQSAVTKVRLMRKSVEIRTRSGTVSASTVVHATGYPTDDYRPLHRRFFRTTAYTVLTPELPAAVRRDMLPQNVVLRDAAVPDHWLRWVGSRILWTGGSRPKVVDRLREKALVQNAMELMYELSVLRPGISGIMPEYAWDIEYARTADDVPFFGPHRNYPRHLFAFGGAAGGLGLTFTAARILLRSYLGKPDKGDEPFSFTRIRE